MVGSHEVAGSSDTKTFLWPNGFNSGSVQLHTSQNVATSIPSLTSQSCSDSLPSVCLAGKVGAIYRLVSRGQTLLRRALSIRDDKRLSSLIDNALRKRVWPRETIYRPPEHPWTPDRPVIEASVKADR